VYIQRSGTPSKLSLDAKAFIDQQMQKNMQQDEKPLDAEEAMSLSAS